MWAYGELTSARFSETYFCSDMEGLFMKARDEFPFKDLSVEEKGKLEHALKTHGDRRGLYRVLQCFSEYRSEAIDYERLRNSSLVKGLDSCRFADFEQGMCGVSRGAELRAALSATPKGDFVQSDAPVIIIPSTYHNKPFDLLLEGTFRSLLFARDHSSNQLLKVWVPIGNPLCLDGGPRWL